MLISTRPVRCTPTTRPRAHRTDEAGIFEGAFLDPRSSAVFGVFLFIGTYAFGLLRATKPRLYVILASVFLNSRTLMAIFGTIILDREAAHLRFFLPR